MALSSLLGGMSQSYLRGAASGWGQMRAISRGAGIDIGDFREASVIGTSTGAAGIEITNLDAIRRELRQAAPNLYRKLNRDLKKVGVPAQEKVYEAYKKIQQPGPLGPPRRKGRIYDRFATSEVGRLSWVNSKTLDPRRAVELNFKNRNKARDWANIKNGKDGTLSIVRVMVKAPAFVVADVAGNSGRGRSPIGKLTREYQINLFGKGIVTRQHRITSKLSNSIWENWVTALDDRKRAPQASRYAWPAVDEHMPKFRQDTSEILNQVITQINQRMQG